MCIKKTYIHNILILAVGLLLTVTLASCKKIKGDAGTPTDTAGEVDPSGGDLTQGDFQLTSLEPSSGKSGDRFVLTGEVLDAATDLVMFGEIPVIPHAADSGARQFFFASTSVQTAKTDEAKGQISAFVPQGVCDQEYVVIVVRSDKRSTGKKFTVLGEKPCPGSADETDDAEEAEETEVTEPTTVGETVVGGEGEGDLQPESVPVEATLGLSREIVYRQLDPTTTLSWSVGQGVVDAVTLYANGHVLSHGGVIYHNHPNVNGSVDLEPLEATQYQAVFTDHGEVKSVQEAHVTVIGEENDLSIIPYFDIEVSPLAVSRNSGNGYVPPPVTVQFVANRITGIDFTFSELCVTPPCPSLGARHYTSLNGTFNFLSEETGVFRAVATTDEGETIVIEKNIAVTINSSVIEYTVKDWEQRTDQSYLPGYAKYKVKVKDTQEALVSGGSNFHPCLWIAASSTCVPLPIINTGGLYFYRIPLETITAGAGGWKIFEFYWKQDCGPVAGAQCESRLAGVGYDDSHPSPRNLSVMSLTPSATLETSLTTGDWTKWRIHWTCLHCAEVTVINSCTSRQDHLEDQTEVKSDDYQVNVCKQNKTLNNATLTYRGYFSNTQVSIKENPTEGPNAPSASWTTSGTPGNRHNGADGNYQTPWRVTWAKRAWIAAFERQDNGSYTECGGTRRELLSAQGFNHNFSTHSAQRQGTDSRFPVAYHCYHFKILYENIEGSRQWSSVLTAQPQVFLDIWGPVGGSVRHGIRYRDYTGWEEWWGMGPDYCERTAYTYKYRIKMVNTQPGTMRITSRAGFECPSERGGFSWGTDEDGRDRAVEKEGTIEWVYNGDKAYGCMACVTGVDGVEYCNGVGDNDSTTIGMGAVPFELENEHPSYYYSWCDGKSLRGYDW
ncbi:MAG: hypothetical protein A3B79_06065 [Deltaproteobacteria bacterium RIFCSPHIGHO2_02_FULL_50_15]|nr:MAG: hypothetical protein A3B79_06065 [Deltaproteobacteria bacterium RIFCSPHIGHO2_02_FULL_50_15]